MTEPKFSMVHQANTYEETIIDGFAIYAFLSYSDCEESTRQHDCLDDTEEEESVHGDKRTPTTNATSKSPSTGGYIRNYGPKQRSRSDSRSSIGDTPNGSIYLENGKNMLFHRSLAKRKAGRPKGGYRRSRIQIKHEIFTDLRDSSIDAQQLDCLYNDYLQDRFKKEEENKYKFTIPKSMDENFVNLSLNALDSSLNKPFPTTTTPNTTRVDNINIKKELKNGIENNNADDYHHHNIRKETFVKIPETPENDVDLTEMISRHSKREIRLPARYHQSGLLMGSQWVIPELDSEEKIPKKKIKIEEPDEPESSMETTTQVITQTLVYHHPKQELSQRQPLTQPQLTQPQQISARSQPSTSPLPPPLQPQQLMQKPLSTPPPLLHKQSHFKPLYSCENQRIIYSTSNSSNNNNIDRTTEEDKTLSSGLFNESKGSITNNNVDDVSNLNSPIKTSCPSLVSHLKLHQEKIEKLQLLRKQQEAGSGGGKLCENNTVINNSSKDYHQEVSPGDKGVSIISPIISDRSDLINNKMDSTSPSCGSPELKQNQSKPLVSTYLTPVGLNSSQSSSDSSTTPTDNPDVQDQKSPRQQQLRQLYRDLYFENKPERRLIYAKNRIKPRVNKKSEVEEAIKVIEKLNKRNKQLDYIKKLLTMWNKKLTLAAKVINDKEVIPKGIDIVRDVLKTYQASKSYRVTEAWNLLSKSRTEPSPTSLSTISNQSAIESSHQQPSLVSQPTPTPTTMCAPSSIGKQQQQQQLLQTSQPVSQPIQTSRQFVKSCSSVIKTTGSLSRIVVNPQAKSNVTPESRVNLKTLTLPVTTTTLTTITSSTKTIDHHSSSASTEKSSNGVSVLSKISNSPPRIKPMVPLNQSQSSNQPSHVHIYPSLPSPIPPPPPPPLPPPLQASYSLTSLTRPPTQQPLPTILSTPLSNLNLILIVRAKNNQRRIERIELQK